MIVYGVKQAWLSTVWNKHDCLRCETSMIVYGVKQAWLSTVWKKAILSTVKNNLNWVWPTARPQTNRLRTFRVNFKVSLAVDDHSGRLDTRTDRGHFTRITGHTLHTDVVRTLRNVPSAELDVHLVLACHGGYVDTVVRETSVVVKDHLTLRKKDNNTTIEANFTLCQECTTNIIIIDRKSMFIFSQQHFWHPCKYNKWNSRMLGPAPLIWHYTMPTRRWCTLAPNWLDIFWELIIIIIINNNNNIYLFYMT